jgi:dCTP deaminase
MTILCDTDLDALARAGLIEEYDPAFLNPASIDIRIGRSVIMEECQPIQISSYGLVVMPGEWLLVETYESFNVPNGYAMDLRLKSSIARQGWNHSLAFWVDPGWRGRLTMEIQNIRRGRPLNLMVGQRFGQIIVHKLSGPAAKPYQGKYNNATGVEGPKT